MYKLSQLQKIDFGRVEALYSGACYGVHVHIYSNKKMTLHIYSNKKMNTAFYPAKQRKSCHNGVHG